MAEASQTAASPWQLESLEQRVHRLEDAVAAMQDTRLLEERVAQRIKERVNGNLSERPSSAAGIIIEAGRHVFPATAEPGGAENSPINGEAAASRSGPSPALAVARDLRRIACHLLDVHRSHLPPQGWTGRLAPIAILFFLFRVGCFYGWLSLGPLRQNSRPSFDSSPLQSAKSRTGDRRTASQFCHACTVDDHVSPEVKT